MGRYKEIRNRIIELNSTRRVNVFVSQVYSKELKLRRNSALKYHRDYLNENSNVQIKLEFPVTLRYLRRGLVRHTQKFLNLDNNQLSQINHLGPSQRPIK